jgi:hypothetical protein
LAIRDALKPVGIAENRIEPQWPKDEGIQHPGRRAPGRSCQD